VTSSHSLSCSVREKLHVCATACGTVEMHLVNATIRYAKLSASVFPALSEPVFTNVGASQRIPTVCRCRAIGAVRPTGCKPRCVSILHPLGVSLLARLAACGAVRSHVLAMSWAWHSFFIHATHNTYLCKPCALWFAGRNGRACCTLQIARPPLLCPNQL
jgi:hypothetical protein